MIRFILIAFSFLLLAPLGVEASMAAEAADQETISAIISKKPIDKRKAWKPAGDAARLPAKVDYDGDKILDEARLVSNGIQTGVELTSGKTKVRKMIWLIDGADLADDVYLNVTRKGCLEVVFPESTSILLFQKNGAPMATYANG